MDAAAAAAPRGLPDALRAIGATLGRMAGVRGALFALDLREELQRRAHMLGLAAAVLAFAQLALLLFALLVVAAFWDTHRLAALAAMATHYHACGCGALVLLRARLAASPPPFASTVAELGADLASLRAAA